MTIDGYYVIGRETNDGIVFMQTYWDGNIPSTHWGEIQYADRYLMFKYVKKAAEEASHSVGEHKPAVYKVEINVTKETNYD